MNQDRLLSVVTMMLFFATVSYAASVEKWNAQPGNVGLAITTKIGVTSANFQFTCGFIHISSGWNVNGEPMQGVSGSGVLMVPGSERNVTVIATLESVDSLRVVVIQGDGSKETYSFQRGPGLSAPVCL